MKNILLIITLLISWNAIAEEKAWYCSTEERSGLLYENGTWKSTVFEDIRMTVKQKDNALSFGGHLYNGVTNCYLPYSSDSEIIQCHGPLKMFTLNTNTGLATSSKTFGWIDSKVGDNEHDTPTVSVWKCESF